MSAQALAAPPLNQNTSSNITRRTANFSPDIWGDRFLSYASEFTNINNDMEEQVQRLKEEVRRMIIASTHEPSKDLNLIDSIQRLGVAYHFENEIEEALLRIHCSTDNYNDLHSAALRFRLLRQQGFNVSCDVFNKFRDSNGHLNETLKNDIQGILSLYEAAYLRVHGEDILEEALAFSTVHLKSIANAHTRSPFAAQVSRALKQPIRKGLQRLESKHYISMYQEDASHNEVLLTFAKLDFNVLQMMHREELRYISKWRKDLDFKTKLPFVRDRVVECYFWTIGVWDIACMDQLPEYMKLCYMALLDIYDEMERELSEQGSSSYIHYAKDEMKKLVQAYLVEANWMSRDYIPTMDEYMSIALVTGGYPLLTTTSFIGMGDISTKDVFDWSSNGPKIVRAASVIARLMDDIVSHEFEQARGHVASAVECYMKQNGVSEEATRDEFNKQIVSAWKDINEACLKPTEVPLPILTRVVNLARVMDYLYKDGDEYTHTGELMKSSITSVFIDPVQI
ncbi:hypothetical protein JCGZ_09953 [Jatropha curcas]|uniref:(+)-delta-cadinene synthase n=1 Tax=Jatropha curcas TaxID=180498 RepID=A0A067KMP6_JATCU|nr:hypothetical protein JCGZ_09953 [Jatropha curcas]